MFKQKKYVFIRSDKEQRLTINYEKKLCVYSNSLYRVCYYFFLQIIEQTSEKQNDLKQNFLYSKKIQKENFKKIYYSTYVFNNTARQFDIHVLY